jgi:hypothetical protein
MLQKNAYETKKKAFKVEFIASVPSEKGINHKYLLSVFTTSGKEPWPNWLENLEFEVVVV